MLPRRAPQQHFRHSSRRGWCSLFALVSLALCVAMPFLWWQYSNVGATLQTPRGTPLQRLQQQRAVDSSQQSREYSATLSTRQYSRGPAAFGGGDSVTSEQVAAAQRYLQTTVQHPQPRPAVPASRYVIKPEPYDMRLQHKKVEAYLNSAEFAAKQAARRASGGRGIIINAGGPQLISSTIVSLKVLREVLNCTLPIELVWHSAAEMDSQTLSALQSTWGPIRGVDLSSMPFPAHHRAPAAPTPHSTAEQAATSPPDQPASAGAASSRNSAGGLPGEAGVQHSSMGSSKNSSRLDGGSPLEAEGLPEERAAAKQRAFLFKVLSLTVSSFASALLLDADNLPLANPELLWSDAGFKLYGNMFWPDFWPPGSNEDAQDVVFDMVGLEAHVAGELLAAGKGPGMSWRGTESGQVLLDLVRHGDVAEWALWINSYGDTVYRALWGDKDTYSLAFAVAGRAHEFNQLQVPPAGAFSWRPRSVLVKATHDKMDGWQLAGMVQYDARGQPAFLHRTMNKLSLDDDPWEISLLTAPLPRSWIQYYLSLDSLGPTVGVPVTYAAPASAFDTNSSAALTRDPADQSSSTNSDSDGGDDGAEQRSQLSGCPQDTFKSYWTLRRHAVPIGRNLELEAVCEAALAALLGPLAGHFQSAQLKSHPEVLGIAALAAQDGVLPGSQNPGVQHGSVRHEQPPDPTPVVAWVVLKKQTGHWSSFSVQQVLQAATAALHWTQQHVQEFPLLAESVIHGGASTDSAQQHGQQGNTDTSSGPLGALPRQHVG